MVLGRWFGRHRKKAPGRQGRPLVPAGLRVYAIGDIHGRVDLLDALHAAIVDDAAQHNALQQIIVYLGDYVDRGMESKATLERLLAGPPQGFRAIHLKGNHEQAVLDFLKDAEFGMVWRNFGGLETLHSYGIADAASLGTVADFRGAQKTFAAALPDAHLRFLQELRLSVSFGDYFFVHAGIHPDVRLERQREQDLLWIREPFLSSTADFGKIVVHGHTPEPEPVIRSNRIGVDTGAYMTGVLTALVLKGDTRDFIQVGGPGFGPERAD